MLSQAIKQYISKKVVPATIPLAISFSSIILVTKTIDNAKQQQQS